jgi:hypothetical protein
MGPTRHADAIPRWAEQRRQAIAAEIAEIAARSWALPGSLKTTVMTRCRHPGCRCRAPRNPRRHGPYNWWCRPVNAKTVTKVLTPAQAERYAPWIESNRRLAALIDELRGLALIAITAQEGWPPLPTPPRQTIDTAPASHPPDTPA